MDEKKNTFFVMSPDGFFRLFFRVSKLPLLRNAQKNVLKQIDKKIKNK
jgi:hypothetical protein